MVKQSTLQFFAFALITLVILKAVLWRFQAHVTFSCSIPKAEILEGIEYPSGEPYNLVNSTKKDYSQNGQSTALLEIFKRQKHLFFLEAGALDGEDISNTLSLEKDYGWSGVLIEPDSKSFRTMLTKHRKAILIPHCIGTRANSAQMLTFRSFVESKWGSRLMVKSRYKLPIEAIDPYMDIKMKCFPLACMLRALNIAKLDLLVLDIEGAENAVIRTFPWKSVEVDVVMIECLDCYDNEGNILDGNIYIKEKAIGLRQDMQKLGFIERQFIEKHDVIYVRKGANY